jgi:hypothetical protein
VTAPDRAAQREEFLTALRARLEKGAQEYGDLSFDRPAEETVEEILQEVLDIAGWTFVLREQLRQRLKAGIQKIANETKE